jgi:hypothetical protein
MDADIAQAQAAAASSGMAGGSVATMMYLPGILIFLAGVLAASGLILSKRPDAKDMINKIVPYQGIIGIGLLGYGVYYWVSFHGGLSYAFKFKPLLPSLGMIGFFFDSLLLGLILGAPLLGKWAGGGNAEKVANMQAKLVPYQTLLGIIGIVTGIIMVLTGAGILK